MRKLAFLGSIALILPLSAVAQTVPDVRVAPSSLNRTEADRARETQAADAERRRTEDAARRDAQAAARVAQRPTNDASIGAGSSLATPPGSSLPQPQN